MLTKVVGLLTSSSFSFCFVLLALLCGRQLHLVWREMVRHSSRQLSCFEEFRLGSVWGFAAWLVDKSFSGFKRFMPIATEAISFWCPFVVLGKKTFFKKFYHAIFYWDSWTKLLKRREIYDDLPPSLPPSASSFARKQSLNLFYYLDLRKSARDYLACCFIFAYPHADHLMIDSNDKDYL